MVLKHEDGEEDNIMMQLDESMRQKLLTRKGYCEADANNKNRRKSRRRSTNTPPTTPNGSSTPIFPHPIIRRLSSNEDPGKDSMDDGSSTTSSHSSSPGPPNGTPPPPPYIITGYANEKCNTNVEITPALRRRRERVPDHHKGLLDQKTMNGSTGELSESLQKDSLIPLGRSLSGKKETSNSPSLEQQNNLKNSSSNGSFNGNCGSPNGSITVARPWMLPIYTKTNGTATSSTSIANGEPESPESSEAKREHTVKDLTQKLANQSLLTSPVDENKSLLRSGELSGVVSKAKEGLAKSKSRVDLKPPTGESGTKGVQMETKKSDNDFHWDFLVMNLHRSLEICDLDFTDLKTSDDEDIMAPNPAVMLNCHIPPPLPPMFSSGNPPPPPPGRFGAPPPPAVNGFENSVYGSSVNNRQSPTDLDGDNTLRKTKKTVKLFWKEVRDDPITASKVEKVGSLWTELQPVTLDTQRLEHLFESRAKDVINKV
ncbi:FH1/FH2 domain-containing protein 3 [Orchesella cincta]|uniref:FH1/FH2 domain-containing protein 3 n=1 Tax=Orchesella cincta TaxID=48709 RepID=A0A1D2MET5_ORCCI|nr:FH1/FH2 domain-containing protein 3 [Orchesella cincta]